MSLWLPFHCHCFCAIRVTETPITVIAISSSLFLCHPSWILKVPITVIAISSSWFLVPSWLLKALVTVTAISSSFFLVPSMLLKPPSLWSPFHCHCFCAICYWKPRHCDCHFIVIVFVPCCGSTHHCDCHFIIIVSSAILVTESPRHCDCHFIFIVFVPSALLKAPISVIAISSSLFLCHPRYWKPPSVWSPFHHHCFCAIRVTESPNQCDRHFIVIVFVPSALLKAPISVIAISSSLFLCHPRYWKPPSQWLPFHRHCLLLPFTILFYWALSSSGNPLRITRP